MITRRKFIRTLSLLMAAIHLPLSKSDLAKEPDSANAWHHACTVFSANDARVVSLDGITRAGALPLAPLMGDPAQEPALPNQAAYGTFCKTEFHEWAWWDACLTDTELALLASGISPSLVRPQNLVYWCPRVPRI